MPYPGPSILAEQGQEHRAGIAVGLGHCMCPLTSPRAWDQCPPPWGCGGVSCVLGALDSPQKDAVLSSPGQGTGTAPCPANLGMGGATEAQLIWVSSAWGADPLFS